MKAYPLNQPCPCNSGKTYKRCCKRKIEYLIDENGNISQRIELQDEAFEIIEKNMKEFKALFGREPGPDDPIFFHNLLISEEDYMEGLSVIYREKGLPEEHLYAHMKTGIVVTEMNINNLPDVDILAYKKAIKEYHDIQKGKRKIQRPDILLSIETLLGKLEHNQYLLGLIIRKQNDTTQTKEFDENISTAEYLLFCLTKNLKTLRGAISLIESNFGEDSLNLIRSIFENYLHIAMSIRSSDFIDDIKIKIGLLKGTHRLKIKNGDKIIEVATGNEVRLKYSKNYKLASFHPVYGHLDIEIYRYLYEFLSNFTHPNLATLSCYTDENGFNHLKRNFSSEATLYISFINLLILHELKSFDGIDSTSITDINYYTQQVAPHLIKVFEQAEKDFPNYPGCMRERVEVLLTK